MIERASSKIGNYHRPKAIIEQVKHDYDTVVTNSSVWKALGSTSDRRKYSGNPIIERQARHYLNSVGYDMNYAVYVLKSVASNA
jgi:hypothetical protein